MSSTLWITGAAGFTGRHLADAVSAGADRPRVVGLDLARRVEGALDDYACVDLCDASAVEATARRLPPRWVIHLAAVTSAPDPAAIWDTNVRAVSGLSLGLAAARCRGVRLLGIGSAAEYAPASGTPLTERSAVGPVSEYGQAKLAQTLLTLALGRTLGFDACVARTFNLLGPLLPSSFVAGRLVDQFVQDSHEEVRIAHTASGRDFLDVRDAADAYWRLVRCGRAGHVYNVCSGRAVMIGELVERLAGLTRTARTVRPESATPADVDSSVVFGSYAKLRRDTGWTPRISLERSLADMLAGRAAARSRNGQRSDPAAAPVPLSRLRSAAASPGARR